MSILRREWDALQATEPVATGTNARRGAS
jgi:hypothetical protein